MSLIVLNSQGQDPAEWENHFGRGIKLPQNAEVCLCGVNLNKWEIEEGAVIVQDNNDAFMVSVGDETSVLNRAYSPYGSYRVKIKSGNYTALALSTQITNALAVGNYQTRNGTNYQDIPISYFRGGLLGTYDAINKKLKLTCKRHYVFADEPDMASLDEVEARGYVGVVGTSPDSAFVMNLGLTLGVDGTINPSFEQNPDDLTYAQFNPKTDCNTAMITRALWNGSNGAGILEPNAGALGVAAGGNILPPQEYGYSWYFKSTGNEEPERMLGWRGGIFRNNKQSQINQASGQNLGTERSNRNNLALDWASGGLKYDMWWEIESFRPSTSPTVGTYDGSVYYMPTINDSNAEPYLESNKVKVGAFRWATGAGGGAGTAAPNLMMVNFRPVDGKGGTDANAPQATNAADRTKLCIDIRATRGVPLLPILAGSVAGMIAPATAAGVAGYVAVTDVGDFNLYKGAPIYMGCDNDLADNNFVDNERCMMKGIFHDAATALIRPMTNINGAAGYVDGAAVIADMELSFLPVNFGFSPLTESTQAPFLNNSIVNMTKRFSNIAASIGFREGVLTTMSSAESATGISSDFASGSWNDKETVCIVQLPTIGIDGELGGGSGNYGGANSANILGVVGLGSATGESITGGVYREPSMENWIKIKNLAHDSINQLKVKLTDTTGRKLKCLQPESTIWLKIRECRNDGGLKTGGVNPIAKPQGMLDRGYNSFY